MLQYLPCLERALPRTLRNLGAHPPCVKCLKIPWACSLSLSLSRALSLSLSRPPSGMFGSMAVDAPLNSPVKNDHPCAT